MAATEAEKIALVNWARDICKKMRDVEAQCHQFVKQNARHAITWTAEDPASWSAISFDNITGAEMSNVIGSFADFKDTWYGTSGHGGNIELMIGDIPQP